MLSKFNLIIIKKLVNIFDDSKYDSFIITHEIQAQNIKIKKL